MYVAVTVFVVVSFATVTCIARAISEGGVGVANPVTRAGKWLKVAWTSVAGNEWWVGHGWREGRGGEGWRGVWWW